MSTVRVAPASGVATGELVVGVDAGGSKTDAVALTREGELVGHARGAGASPHVTGVDAAVDTISALVTRATGGDSVSQANLYVSGLDLPIELDRFAAAIADEPWASATSVADNDLFALLRAGTESPDAAAVICGTGINAVAVRGDGATARYPALGTISGDWGGGLGLGEQALWHAARAADGRGPATALERAVPAAFGLPDLTALIEGLHFGRVPSFDLYRAAPAVLSASAAGDEVARRLVMRQADEIVEMAVSALRRLGLDAAAVPVVLGGGIIRSGDATLLGAVHELLAERAPAARVELVRAAPIVGAGLLALESAGAGSDALARARRALEAL